MACDHLFLVMTPRRGTAVAFDLLVYACVLMSLVSERAAEWLSDTGGSLIVRFGYRLTFETRAAQDG